MTHFGSTSKFNARLVRLLVHNSQAIAKFQTICNERCQMFVVIIPLFPLLPFGGTPFASFSHFGWHLIVDTQVIVCNRSYTLGDIPQTVWKERTLSQSRRYSTTVNASNTKLSGNDADSNPVEFRNFLSSDFKEFNVLTGNRIFYRQLSAFVRTQKSDAFLFWIHGHWMHHSRRIIHILGWHIEVWVTWWHDTWWISGMCWSGGRWCRGVAGLTRSFGTLKFVIFGVFRSITSESAVVAKIESP